MLENKVKPKVELKEAVVNTTTMEELDTLMKIYELNGNIKWKMGDSPVTGSLTEKRFKFYKENTCINLEKGKLSYGSADIYMNVLSFKQFCELNNITSEKLNEIKDYFN